MKPKLHTVIFAALFLVATPFAAAGDKPHSQQDKFAQCAHDSKGLKGEERNKFMSECLKAHEPAKAKDAPAVKEARHDTERQESQQNRMKSCNEEAGRKELRGDERRAFMSTCLKGRG